MNPSKQRHEDATIKKHNSNRGKRQKSIRGSDTAAILQLKLHAIVRHGRHSRHSRVTDNVSIIVTRPYGALTALS